MDADHRPPKEGRPASDPEDATTPDEPQPEGRRRRGNRHHAFRRKNRARQGPRESSATGGDSRESATSGSSRESPTGGRSRGATTPRMQGARPSGRTPGVSTADEPAAAPLGTDDEAAGTPPRAADLDREISRAERGEGMQGLKASDAMSGRPGHPEESPLAFGKLVTIAAAVLVLVVLAYLLF